MKKILFIITSFLILNSQFSIVNCQNSPDQIVKDIISNIEKNVISADFSLQVKANGETTDVEGKFTLKNEKFTVETPEMKIWFDGKTQWAYSPQTNEVSITEPEKEELAAINPLLFIKNIYKNCTLTFGKTKMTAFNLIIFTPKTSVVVAGNTKQSPADFKNIELIAGKTSNVPATITLYGRDNSVSTFALTSYKSVKSAPDSSFTFNKNNYKGVYINDLR